MWFLFYPQLEWFTWLLFYAVFYVIHCYVHVMMYTLNALYFPKNGGWMKKNKNKSFCFHSDLVSETRLDPTRLVC